MVLKDLVVSGDLLGDEIFYGFRIVLVKKLVNGGEVYLEVGRERKKVSGSGFFVAVGENTVTAGENSGEKNLWSVAGEEEVVVSTWFFEDFEKRVLGFVVELVGILDDN